MKLKKLVSLFIAVGLLMTGAVVLGEPAKTAQHHAAEQKSDAVNIVNINTADVKQLTTLKRIGTKKAQAIVDYRTAHGAFTSVNDLAKVKGISQKMIDANQGRITV